MTRRCITIAVAGLCLLLAWPSPILAADPSLAQNPDRVAGTEPSIANPTAATPTPAEPGGLSLAQARALALQQNAELAAASAALKGADGQLQQAGLLPNPEVSIDVENFAGEDDLEGFDGAETTLAISQLIELGGKRGKRQHAAELERALAARDYEASRLDALNAVTRAYIEVVAAQNRLKLANGLSELARAVHLIATERVEAGKVSPVEKTRAAVAAAAARLDVEKARRALAAARQQLAAHWGNRPADFGEATDALETSPDLVPLEQLLPLLRQNPDVARWETDLALRRAERSLADAQAVPDLNLSLGLRHYADSDSQALVAGFSLPLPLFDRRQGERQAALAAVSQADRQQEAALIKGQAELTTAYQELSSAHVELSILVQELLPAADSAFAAASLGYREGKFGFLDVLDAQRTLFEVRGQLVAALVSYHLARADIERLIAQPLAEVALPSDNSQEVSR